MHRQQVVLLIDCAMGIAFLVSFATGILKFPLLLQTSGLYRVVMPAALISDIHDWSGIVMGAMVFLHLFMNRRVIAAMAGRAVSGR